MDVIHFTRGADPRSIRGQIRRTSLWKKMTYLEALSILEVERRNMIKGDESLSRVQHGLSRD